MTALSPQDLELIKAAEELASNYDEDDRQDIKTDVMNAFYAGAKFMSERDAQHAKDLEMFRKAVIDLAKRGHGVRKPKWLLDAIAKAELSNRKGE